jgi:hypothetical protein
VVNILVRIGFVVVVLVATVAVLFLKSDRLCGWTILVVLTVVVVLGVVVVVLAEVGNT